MQEQLHALFEANLPDSLYLSHYELSRTYGFTPKEWREYLRHPDNARFIESELAAITEASARAALHRLGSGQASSSDIQAIKQILDKSTLLQQNQNTKQTIILTHMPKKEYPVVPQEQIELQKIKRDDPTFDPDYLTPEQEFELFQKGEID